MVRGGPLVTLARAAPVAHHVAVVVELEHGRRSHAAVDRHRRIGLGLDLAGVERGGAVHNPDVVAFVDRDADGRPDDPVVGQRIGPQRVDLEDRPPDQPVRLRGGLALQRGLAEAQRGNQRQPDDADPQLAVP